jgi:hypothetical protein
MGFGPPPGMPMGFPPPAPKKNRGPLIIALVGGITALCAVCAVFGYFLDKKDQQTFGALAPACEGRPVPGARAYVPGPATHRTVAATRQSDGTWRIASSRVPADLRPTGVADAEVVACLGDEAEATLETCRIYRTRYGIRVPGSERYYPRVQRSQQVRLVAASTGQTITQGSVAGPVPRDCTVVLGTASASDYRGSLPEASQLGAWIRAMLAGGGTGLIPL